MSSCFVYLFYMQCLLYAVQAKWCNEVVLGAPFPHAQRVRTTWVWKHSKIRIKASHIKNITWRHIMSTQYLIGILLYMQCSFTCNVLRVMCVFFYVMCFMLVSFVFVLYVMCSYVIQAKWCNKVVVGAPPPHALGVRTTWVWKHIEIHITHHI